MQISCGRTALFLFTQRQRETHTQSCTRSLSSHRQAKASPFSLSLSLNLNLASDLHNLCEYFILCVFTFLILFLWSIFFFFLIFKNSRSTFLLSIRELNKWIALEFGSLAIFRDWNYAILLPNISVAWSRFYKLRFSFSIVEPFQIGFIPDQIRVQPGKTHLVAGVMPRVGITAHHIGLWN